MPRKLLPCGCSAAFPSPSRARDRCSIASWARKPRLIGLVALVAQAVRGVDRGIILASSRYRCSLGHHQPPWSS